MVSLRKRENRTVGILEGECVCGRFSVVTEAGALAASEWVGRGDGLAGDLASREAMALELAQMPFPFKARVVAGRRGHHSQSALCSGDEIGRDWDLGIPVHLGGDKEYESQREWDLAVDPLQAPAVLARGMDGALVMLAIGPRGSLMSVPEMYMQKMIVGSDAAGSIDMDASVVDNVKAVAIALGRSPADVNVVVLDRPRHEDLIAQVRRAGARLRLISDGDLSAGVAAAVKNSGVDMYIGIGGSTEGIVTAAALRCLGGEMQARFWPVSRRQVEELRAAGIDDVETRLAITDMAREGVIVAGTAVTDSRFLRGVNVRDDGVWTESLVLCSRCHAIRIVKTAHRFEDTGHGLSLDTR